MGLFCPGRFWWGTDGNRGVPHRHRFSPFWHILRYPVSSARARTPCNHPLCLFSSSLWYSAFTSTISIPAAQLADAPHLLRNSSVHESVIGTLRVNAITDRDTFVNMFDSEAALKEGASDFGFDLTTGGLPHKASLLASSLRGKLRKSCLRPSSRQMQLPELMVFQSHCSHVIGPLFSPSLRRQASRSIYVRELFGTPGRRYTEGRIFISRCELV